MIQPDWYKLNDGTWYHIIIVKSELCNKLYIDGCLMKKEVK